MNLKVLNDRITILEACQRSRLQSKAEPAWYPDMPATLKYDVERMERIVKEAGGLSSDPFVLATANQLAEFISEWNNRQVMA